jgi:hypothetical protein
VTKVKTVGASPRRARRCVAHGSSRSDLAQGAGGDGGKPEPKLLFT